MSRTAARDGECGSDRNRGDHCQQSGRQETRLSPSEPVAVAVRMNPAEGFRLNFSSCGQGKLNVCHGYYLACPQRTWQPHVSALRRARDFECTPEWGHTAWHCRRMFQTSTTQSNYLCGSAARGLRSALVIAHSQRC